MSTLTQFGPSRATHPHVLSKTFSLSLSISLSLFFTRARTQAPAPMGTGVQTTGRFARNNPTCLQRASKDKLHEVDQVKSKDQKASGKKSVWERCL